MDDRQLRFTAWTLSGLTVLASVLVWGQNLDWQLSRVGGFALFPLFGLLAFGLMWSHYVVSVIRRHYGLDRKALANYLKITSLGVLVALLLHPAILAWKLWDVGLGLPPNSYRTYVGDGLYGAIIIGSIAWLAFMLYELRRKYVRKPWWRFVQYASDVAMILIFFHGLRLGSHLDSGWFRYIWLFYGVTLAASLVYIHTRPKN